MIDGITANAFKGTQSYDVMTKKFVALVIIAIALAGTALVGYSYLQSITAPPSSTTPPSFRPVPLFYNNTFSSIVGNFSSVSFVFNVNSASSPFNVTNMNVNYTVVENSPGGISLNVSYSSATVPVASFMLYFSGNGTPLDTGALTSPGVGEPAAAIEFWFTLAEGIPPSSGINATIMPYVSTTSEFIGPTAMVVSTYSIPAPFSPSSGITISSLTMKAGTPLVTPINTAPIVIPVSFSINEQSTGASMYLSLVVTSIVASVSSA